MHGTPNSPYGPPPPPMPAGPPPAHSRPPQRRGLLIAGVALAALVVLGGLVAVVTPGDSGGEMPAAASATPSPTTSRETWEYIPADRQEAFTAYLRRLDPGLTPTSEGAKPRPLRRAVNTCWDIYAGKPEATVLRNNTMRYDGGQATVPEGSEKARKILTAVKRWVCSAPELRAVYDQRHP